MSTQTEARKTKYRTFNEITTPKRTEPELSDEQAFEKVDKPCEVCDARPVVRATGLCGPCTFGEADTAGGNW